MLNSDELPSLPLMMCMSPDCLGTLQEHLWGQLLPGEPLAALGTAFAESWQEFGFNVS